MLDGGHCSASDPLGSRKQILHAINLHLFAHHCCQQHLSREEQPSNGRSMGFGLGWLHHSWLSDLGQGSSSF